MITTRLESPAQIQDKIVYYGARKSQAVCEIFIEPKFFFAQPCNKKINAHPYEADYSKFCNPG